jgi:hypothetical protein
MIIFGARMAARANFFSANSCFGQSVSANSYFGQSVSARYQGAQTNFELALLLKSPALQSPECQTFA